MISLCGHCNHPLGSNSDCVWCEKLSNDHFEDLVAESKEDDYDNQKAREYEDECEEADDNN